MRGGFERNARRLAARDARFAAALREAAGASAGRGECVDAARDRVVLRFDGVQLASAWDPEAEARCLVAPCLGAEPDLVVAIGFGSGHALEALRAESSAPVVVFEPDLGRMAFALAQRDLPWLDATTLHWVETPERLAACFRALYGAGLRVEVVPHPVAKRLDPDAVGAALAALATSKRTADISDRTRVWKSADFAAQTVDNLGALLRTPSIRRLAGIYEGVPAVIAAAGPSLDRQLDALGSLGERALVIAIGQSLPALRRAGIRPDFTHIVESQDVSHQLKDGGAAEDVDLIAIPSAHGSLFASPVASRFVATPSPNAVARWIAGCAGEDEWVFGAPTVAQSAVHVAAALGANPILLIGQDLAFTGGRVYAAGSAYRMVSYREVGDGRFVYTGEDEKARLLHQTPRGPESAGSQTVWVEGWDGDKVPTSPQYASFIDHYREVVAVHEDDGVRIVNCTEGGARIPGLEHARFAETLRAARGPVPSRDAVRERFAAYRPVSPDVVATALREVHGALGRLEAARRGLARRLPKLRGELRRRTRPEQQVAALQRLRSSERRLAGALDAIPWLDMVGQRAVHRSRLELHRSSALSPAEAALAEAEALLDTTTEAETHSRALWTRIADALDGLRDEVSTPGERVA